MFQSTKDKVLLTGIGLALVFIHIGLCYLLLKKLYIYNIRMKLNRVVSSIQSKIILLGQNSTRLLEDDISRYDISAYLTLLPTLNVLKIPD